MKLLITGASGFVGRALLAQSVARGYAEVVGIGRRSWDHPHYRSYDLTQPLHLDFTPDVVVHAAARSSPWGSVREFQRQNVDATRHVVDFCLRHGRPKLIYLSSSSVFYRHEHQFGLSETSPIGPSFVNTYAETKYLGERYIREYPGAWSILRPRAVFGRDDTVLFPRILKAARAGRLPLIETADGQPAVGDLISIDSLVHYILRVAESPRITGDYNLTQAEPVSLLPFLLRIFQELGLPPPQRRISVQRAMRLAGITETLFRALPFLGEPPITRFGVSVFAYSKTFDVGKMLSDLGPPPETLDAAVASFVSWEKERQASIS
ncbi:MAG TPA: NAD(P)-dependent oxidoreductase [Opitutaceae bacterium]|nr:NAD(P)-dependent oxidoreductase [Opitutaceae bacterium]